MSRNVNLEGFSSEQLRFMIALADPEDHRTQKEIAADIGVRAETLSRWKQEPGFGERLWELTAHSLQSEVGRVARVMLKGALSGDVRHLRLYFEMLGIIGSQKKQVACTREHALTDEEIVEGMRNQLTERQMNQWCEDIRRKFDISHSFAPGGFDEKDGVCECEYIQVDEIVGLSVA